MPAGAPAAGPPQPDATPATAAAPRHFPGFDAFRAFGMTLVLLVHADFATAAESKGVFDSVLGRMDFGVPIFFMLSGFLLYRPFVAGLLAHRRPIRFGRFMWRRIVRVIPGYWFALAFVVAFLGVRLRDLVDVAMFAFLLFPYDRERALGRVAADPGWGSDTEPLGIAQAWSISAEFAFYLMLPLAAYLMARMLRGRSVRTAAAVTVAFPVACYLAGQAFRIVTVVAEPSWQRYGVIWAPNWIDFFAVGMTMAAISAWVDHGGRCPRLLDFAGRHPALCWAAAVAMFLAVAQTSPPPTPGELGGEYVLRFFSYGPIALALLLPSMFGDQTAGRIRRVLVSPPLRFAGTVSLGFYLFHLAALRQVQHVWFGEDAFRGNFPLIFLATFALSLALAALSYYAVERPFLLLKDRVPRVPAMVRRRAT